MSNLGYATYRCSCLDLLELWVVMHEILVKTLLVPSELMVNIRMVEVLYRAAVMIDHSSESQRVGASLPC